VFPTGHERVKTQYTEIKCTQHKYLHSYKRIVNKPTYTHTPTISTNGYLTICLFFYEMSSPSHYHWSKWTVILRTALYFLRSYINGLTQNLSSSPYSICSMCHAVAIKAHLYMCTVQPCQMSRANKFTVAKSSYIHRSGTLWYASARNDPGTTTPLKILKCDIQRSMHRDIFLI